MKVEITRNTPVLKAFWILFSDIISFQHVLHFDKSQIEWRLKVKTEFQFLFSANIEQNDHSNPYIHVQSTTILSDSNNNNYGTHPDTVRYAVLFH